MGLKSRMLSDFGRIKRNNLSNYASEIGVTRQSVGLMYHKIRLAKQVEVLLDCIVNLGADAGQFTEVQLAALDGLQDFVNKTLKDTGEEE